MATEAKTILLVRRPGAAVPDFAASGLLVVERDLAAVPAVDFDGIDAIIVTPDPVDAALAETRRLRVDLGDTYRPIYWLAPADAAMAFAAGADAVLAEPHAESLALQFVIGNRIRELVDGQRSRAAQVEPLAEQLAKGRAARIADAALARAALRLADSPAPEQFDVFHIAIARTEEPDTTIADAVSIGHTLRIVAATVPGQSLASSLTAMLIRQYALAGSESPGERLRRINRVLAERPTEFLPAAAAILELDGTTGEFRLAQTGLPNAVIVRGNADESLVFGEARLGIFDSVYATRSNRLAPGEALRVGGPPALAVEIRRDHLP